MWRKFLEKSLVKNFTTRQFRVRFRANGSVESGKWSSLNRFFAFSVKHFLRVLLVVAFVFQVSFAALAADTNVALGVAAAGQADAAEEGLPMKAPRLLGTGDEGQFQISNSLVAMFIVAAVLILFAQLATRKPKLVPSGMQNFAEWIIESLVEFLSGIMGEKMARKTFWFYGTIFIMILAANWFGLLPGVGSIGWGYDGAHGFHVSRPILRGANADFNMTFALSVTFFVLWIFWSLRANGVKGFLSHIFVYHGDASGIMRALLVLIFFLVGFLELISIMIRPVSLTFRLYGNIYAGESLLEKMLHMGGPYFGWLAALPFFGLELMVGFIQALVFTLLTAVFTSLMCQHDDGHAAEGHGHEAGQGQAAH